MAIIGKIQKNSVLLLILIGGAMLAFIFTDLMKGGGEEVAFMPIATAYGEALDEEAYNRLVDVYVSQEENSFQVQNQPFTEQQRKQAADRAFNEIVRRAITEREFDKLKLTCTSDELNDMIHGNHIHPWVAQIPLFNGANGQVSRDSIRKFINSLEVEPQTEEQRAQWLDARKQWKAFEEELKDSRKSGKYAALLRKGVFVNSLEAKEAYTAQNETRKIRFVMQRYTDIPKGEVVLDEEEVRAFYEEHKHEQQYETQAARSISYITVPVVPTAEDARVAQLSASELKTSFEDTDDNLTFIASNSSNPMTTDSVEFSYGGDELSLPNGSFAPSGEYPAEIDDEVQNAQVGDVIGPYTTVLRQKQQPVVFLAKVTGLRRVQQAWVRHILIKTGADRTETAAKQLADSLIAVIKEKNNFAEMVQAFSEDAGSLKSNGEYKWFQGGRMVPEFDNASFKGAIGEIQLVKTVFGYHLLEILDRAERSVPKMAVVTKAIQPSENTLRPLEDRIYEFIYTVATSEGDSAFFKLANDSNYQVMDASIQIEQDYINSIQYPEKVMRFVFGKQAAEGAISDPILDGNQYVVAYLNNITEEGVPEFEDVKERMREEALKEKQAEVYIERMGNHASLEEVAAAVGNATTRTAQITYGQNGISGAGNNEPEVVGALFRKELTPGSMTVPLKGNTAVYVCVVDEVSPAPETTDYTQQLTAAKTRRQTTASNLAIKALREKADVQDNRRKRAFQ